MLARAAAVRGLGQLLECAVALEARGQRLGRRLGACALVFSGMCVVRDDVEAEVEEWLVGFCCAAAAEAGHGAPQLSAECAVDDARTASAVVA